MLVVSGKKIKYIVTGIFLTYLIFFILYTFKNKNKNKNYITTVSLPVSGKTVVLDAGHGYPDEGAESNRGVTEEAINLKITKKVQSLLETSGCSVVLTRSDENGIYDLKSNTIKEKKVSDIKNRVKIGNESSADIFVSIHLNKIPQSEYNGWQTFFKENNEESKKLAQCIQLGLNSSIQRENKREPLKITGKYIVEHVEIPISIVECGFLSNKEEETLLQQEEYQDRLAWGIYSGIMDYFYQ